MGKGRLPHAALLHLEALCGVVVHRLELCESFSDGCDAVLDCLELREELLTLLPDVASEVGNVDELLFELVLSPGAHFVESRETPVHGFEADQHLIKDANLGFYVLRVPDQLDLLLAESVSEHGYLDDESLGITFATAFARDTPHSSLLLVG